MLFQLYVECNTCTFELINKNGTYHKYVVTLTHTTTTQISRNHTNTPAKYRNNKIIKTDNAVICTIKIKISETIYKIYFNSNYNNKNQPRAKRHK